MIPALSTAGLVTDRAAHPIPKLAKPEPGQTYVDPIFGTQITRITAADPAEGGNAIIKPGYSTMPVWNADESLLMLWHRGRGHEIYLGDHPYTLLGNLGPYHPTDIESVMWDPIDPEVLYYPSNYRAAPRFTKHRILRDALISTQHDFAKTPTFSKTGDWNQLLSLGSDPQWMSRGPRRLVGLRAGDKAILYSITEDLVVAQAPIALGFKNTLTAMPSEAHALIDRHVMTPSLTYLHKLGMSNPYEHGCPGWRSDGVDVWNAVSFSGAPQGTLVSHRLDTGEARQIIGPPAWPYPPAGTHISSVGPPGWAAIGTVGQAKGQTPLDNEIVLANFETGEVYRVGHSRTAAGGGPWGYWAETHVVISPSGSRIAFGSDWGGSNTVDTYVIDLRQRA